MRKIGASGRIAASVAGLLAAAGSAAAAPLSTVYSFTVNGGYSPYTGLTYSKFGMFGVTSLGADKRCIAALGCGSVYWLHHVAGGGWIEETIHRLNSRTEGLFAVAQLTVDDAGVVYGYSGDLVYRLAPPAPGQTAWAYSVFYKFHKADGFLLANGPPLLYRHGALYGAAAGAPKGCEKHYGCGTLFMLSPGGGGALWTRTALYSFPKGQGGILGYTGFGTDGSIYVSTFDHHGAVVQLAPGAAKQPWTATVISQFSGGVDGSDPISLALAPVGNLFGMSSHRNRGGIVVELTPNSARGGWTRTILGVARQHGYSASSISAGPDGSVVGAVYGDQDLNFGELFSMVPPAGASGAWTYSELWNFNRGPDQNPINVVTAPGGHLFGILSGGGYGNGSVFEYH